MILNCHAIFSPSKLQTHEILQGKNINDIILASILWDIYQVSMHDLIYDVKSHHELILS